MASHVSRGIAFIGLSVLAGWFAFQSVHSNEAQIAASADTAAANAEADDAAAEDEEAWHPSMLCSDEQVLENVIAARRKWLAQLMTEMAREGSYFPPQASNPVSEGAANARITWPNGTRFVSMRETGNDLSADAIEVRCAGAVEIRNAFKLPDNTWSPMYLTLPETSFVVNAGKDGFNLSFPNQQSDADEAIFHVAGEELSLRRLREIATAQ